MVLLTVTLPAHGLMVGVGPCQHGLSSHRPGRLPHMWRPLMRLSRRQPVLVAARLKKEAPPPLPQQKPASLVQRLFAGAALMGMLLVQQLAMSTRPALADTPSSQPAQPAVQADTPAPEAAAVGPHSSKAAPVDAVIDSSTGLAKQWLYSRGSWSQEQYNRVHRFYTTPGAGAQQEFTRGATTSAAALAAAPKGQRMLPPNGSMTANLPNPLADAKIALSTPAVRVAVVGVTLVAAVLLMRAMMPRPQPQLAGSNDSDDDADEVASQAGVKAIGTTERATLVAAEPQPMEEVLAKPRRVPLDISEKERAELMQQAQRRIDAAKDAMLLAQQAQQELVSPRKQPGPAQEAQRRLDEARKAMEEAQQAQQELVLALQQAEPTAAKQEAEQAALQSKQEAEQAAIEARRKQEAEQAALKAKLEAEQAAMEAQRKQEAEQAAMDAKRKQEAEQAALKARLEAEQAALEAQRKEEAEQAALKARLEAEQAALEAQRKEEAEQAALKAKLEAEQAALEAQRKQEAEQAALKAKLEAEQAALEAQRNQEAEQAALKAKLEAEQAALAAERAALDAKQKEAADVGQQQGSLAWAQSAAEKVLGAAAGQQQQDEEEVVLLAATFAAAEPVEQQQQQQGPQQLNDGTLLFTAEQLAAGGPLAARDAASAPPNLGDAAKATVAALRLPGMLPPDVGPSQQPAMPGVGGAAKKTVEALRVATDSALRGTAAEEQQQPASVDLADAAKATVAALRMPGTLPESQAAAPAGADGGSSLRQGKETMGGYLATKGEEGPALAVMGVFAAAAGALAPLFGGKSGSKKSSSSSGPAAVPTSLGVERVPGAGRELAATYSSVPVPAQPAEAAKPPSRSGSGSSLSALDVVSTVLLAPAAPLLAGLPKQDGGDGAGPQRYDMLLNLLSEMLEDPDVQADARYDPVQSLLQLAPPRGEPRNDFAASLLRGMLAERVGTQETHKFDVVWDLVQWAREKEQGGDGLRAAKSKWDPLWRLLEEARVEKEWGVSRLDPVAGLSEWGPGADWESPAPYDPLPDLMAALQSAPKGDSKFDPFSSWLRGISRSPAPQGRSKYDMLAGILEAMEAQAAPRGAPPAPYDPWGWLMAKVRDSGNGSGPRRGGPRTSPSKYDFMPGLLSARAPITSSKWDPLPSMLVADAPLVYSKYDIAQDILEGSWLSLAGADPFEVASGAAGVFMQGMQSMGRAVGGTVPPAESGFGTPAVAFNKAE